MKQRILLIFIIGFLTNMYSQDKKIDFQLSLGPTVSIPKTSELTNSNLAGSPEIKSSVNIGVYILPSIHYLLNEKTSLDFGLGYYLDRFSIEDKIGAVTNKGNRNINQIQTPINFNFHFSQDKSYQIGIGGFANFLLSAKENGDTVTDLSQLNIVNPNDPIYTNNAAVSYDKDIKDNYNFVSFGGFIQIKKSISFSSDTKGFVLLRINQYFNSIKNNDANAAMNQYFSDKSEKEPTTINLGIGIKL